MEELIQYIVVNKDLGMSVGKIAAQVGHVCTVCSEYYLSFGRDDSWCKPSAIEPDTTKYHLWYYDAQKKIILQGHQKDLEKLVNQGFIYIRDNGLTEIPKGSLTAVSLGIMSREEAKPFVKRLQLLH